MNDAETIRDLKEALRREGFPGIAAALDRIEAEVERRRENAYRSALRIADALAKMADEIREDVESDRAALAEEPGAHHDAGPGPEHERGPNMKDVG